MPRRISWPARAQPLVDLPVVVGRDLKSFGLLTRKDEPLSEVATTFVAHLHRSVAAQPERGRRARAAAS
ncbi:MAG TPA: hypothetical protein VMG60_21285 [Burkholderiaceae bacterium]|nr:hypothetical protein [Burkholderiaceae bacterium]